MPYAKLNARRLAMVLLAGLAMSSSALGQFSPKEQSKLQSSLDEAPMSMSDLVRELGSDDARTRGAAQQRLDQDQRITLQMIEEALKQPTTGAEARVRLINTGRTRFVSSPRAAMGVRFGGGLPDRVIVGDTVPGFPSKDFLESGDIIDTANGLKLIGPRASFTLMCLIVSHDPGEKVNLVVRRGGDKLKMQVPLGKYSDLQQGDLVGDSRAQAGWRLRLQRLLHGAESKPPSGAVSFNLPAEAFDTKTAEERQVELMERVRDRGEEGHEPALELAGGGMPRAALDVAVGTGIERGQNQVVLQQIMPAQRGARRQVLNFVQMRNVFEPDLETHKRRFSNDQELEHLLRQKTAILADLKGNDPDAMPALDPRRTMLMQRQRDYVANQKLIEAIEAETEELKTGSPAKHSQAGADQPG